MADKQIIERRRAEPWRKRLRQALDDRRLSYSDVSEASGNNAEYVSKLLNGRLNPTVDRVLLICGAVGIDPTYLFAGPGEDEVGKKVVGHASGLSESEAALVSRLVASARKP